MDIYKGKLEDATFTGWETSKGMESVIRDMDDFRVLLRLKPKKNATKYSVYNIRKAAMCVERGGMVAQGTVSDFVTMNPGWADVIEEILGETVFGRCLYCGEPLLDPERVYCDAHRERGHREDREKIMRADPKDIQWLAGRIAGMWTEEYQYALEAYQKAHDIDEKKAALAHIRATERQLRGKQFTSLTMGAADPEDVIAVYRKKVFGGWEDQKKMIKSKTDAELFSADQIAGICRHCRRYGKDKCRQCAIPIVAPEKMDTDKTSKSE